ncbi:hypothetical protein Y032_0009g549 [Ancylostoma ceylanicum]|uniref:Uncharacterized protein n=1 Tax=Ancylostoma ceylanicum TaxID=53326 RepID=A0A016VJF3_9BILA|nr:hypothetical protein Y032_0009g549 [Ancylostoma ceylanicum]
MKAISGWHYRQAVSEARYYHPGYDPASRLGCYVSPNNSERQSRLLLPGLVRRNIYAGGEATHNIHSARLRRVDVAGRQSAGVAIVIDVPCRTLMLTIFLNSKFSTYFQGRFSSYIFKGAS